MSDAYLGQASKSFVIAKYDYNAQGAKELNIHQGERLLLLDDSGEWWTVKNVNNYVGIVASNFVEKVSTDSSSSSSNQNELLSFSHRLPNYVVRYDYKPKQKEELKLIRGQSVQVLERWVDDWWRGRLGRKIGWFPSNYVEEENVAASASFFARFNFNAKQVGELTIKMGESLVLVDEADNWMLVRNANNRVGEVPSNYVINLNNDSATNDVGNREETPKNALGISLSPMQFHEVYGLNAALKHNRTVAMRHRHGNSIHACFFTSRTIRPNEVIVIQVERVDGQDSNGLAFGVTNCSPNSLRNYTFPDDPYYLAQRSSESESWAYCENVAGLGQPSLNDELAFYIDSKGDIYMRKNAGAPKLLMCVDVSLAYYMYFDVCGSTKSIRLAGCGMLPDPGAASFHEQDNQPLSSGSVAEASVVEPRSKECSICMIRLIDSTVSPCGHVGMCYECGKEIWQKHGRCPFCRKNIQNIIRLYYTV